MSVPILTNLDPNQISRYSFDENLRASRVVIVGDQGYTGTSNISGERYIKPEPLYIEKPVIVTQIEYREVEIPKIVTQIEYKEIQVPVIVKEIEYKEIVKEIPVEKTVYKEIEKPVFIDKLVKDSFPSWLKICFAIQTLAFILIAIKR